MASALTPVALYGLDVPAGEVLIPVAIDFPATVTITMAAINPLDEPLAKSDGTFPNTGRSTLKLVKRRVGPIDDDDEDDEDYLEGLEDDDDEDSDSDEEANGGPSDPSKSKKARAEAAIKKLLESANAEDDDDEDVEMDGGEAGKSKSKAKPNGAKSSKGKEPATEDDEEEEEEESDDEDDEDEEGLDLEEFVLCTLDTERNYQQPLNITICEGEQAFFMVQGSHSVYLTGNYMVDVNHDEDDEDEDDEEGYDLPPGIEDLIGDDSSDELDEVEQMERIREIDTDEEEAPPLVETKKGKKRPAADEEEAEGLDDMIAKAGKAEEPKLSKKQLKKLKNNNGQAVGVKEDAKAASSKDAAATTPKSDKKVQFAKNLEQGPTGSAEKAKAQDSKKASLGKKVVQGVTIDDRTVGKGRVAKPGDKVSMRYIGKLENGKVFDANKKGPPFTFKVGKGEVIKGWDIGIAGMAIGGERRLTIPPSLAYGSKKLDGIPPNSTLIFDVKLLEIK